MGNPIYIHEIKLESESEFAKQFNAVSDAWQRSVDESLTAEEREQAKQEWFHKKCCLEMGV